ncbi:unnamed protein product, partial [Staurois parvus]
MARGPQELSVRPCSPILPLLPISAHQCFLSVSISAAYQC